MTVEEFAKYVIDNLSRATVGNALNISYKLVDSKESKALYNFNSFQKAIYSYVCSLVAAQKLPEDKAMRVYCLGFECSSKLNSNYKYNELMVVDDYITALWRLFN